jgi:hypothetical protein
MASTTLQMPAMSRLGNCNGIDKARHSVMRVFAAGRYCCELARNSVIPLELRHAGAIYMDEYRMAEAIRSQVMHNVVSTVIIFHSIAAVVMLGVCVATVIKVVQRRA